MQEEPAVIAQRDALARVPKEARRRRVRTLKRLFEMFEGNNAADEVRRVKMEDPGF